MYDAVLFDLDRTLIDLQSFTDYTAALNDVERRFDAWDEADVPGTGWDAPTKRCMHALFSLSGDPRWQELSDEIEKHERAALESSQAMPGLEAALAATAGIARAVVTLVPPSTARAALDMHGVGIDVLVARRPDLRPKPAPDQPAAACALLGVRPERAVMLGDSTWDREAALAAGCSFVGVTNGATSEFPVDTDLVSDLDQFARRWAAGDW